MNWRRCTSRLLALTLLMVGHAHAADDADFLQRVQSDTRWLDGYGSRQVGTASHARVQQDLLAAVQQLAQNPGAQPSAAVRVWTDEFEVVAPIDEETFLELSDGPMSGRHPIRPLWPDVVRLNTTPAEGIRGRLVYIDDAAYEHLPARGLRGQIAVMEISSYEAYRRAFDFGASAVLLLESPTPFRPLPSQQALYKPRYYVPEGPLAQALRAGSASSARIVSRGRWETVTARNIYVGLTPADTRETSPLVVAVPYDSMSLVMGDAPGADAALDCATALNLLRDAARTPPRPLLFGFVDAYHLNQSGMRRMAATLNLTPSEPTRQDYEQLEQSDLREYQAAAQELAQFDRPEQGLARLHDRSACQQLRRLFKDTLGRDLLRLRELQGELRLASKRSDAENTRAIRLHALTSLRKSTAWLLSRHESELSDEERRTVEAVRQFAAEQSQAEEAAEQESSGSSIVPLRDRALELLPILEVPLQSRNRVLDAAFSAELEVAPEQLPVARATWEEMSQRVRGQVAEQEQRLAYFEPMDRLRAELSGFFSLKDASAETAVGGFILGLDLSDCGVLVGPGLSCAYNRIEPTDRAFLRTLKQATKRGEVWPEGSELRRAVNLGSIDGRAGVTQNLGSRAMITSAAASFMLPGVTWITDDAPRQRIDSPLDRYDQLSWERLGPQLAATRRFFDWLCTTEALKTYKPPEPNEAGVWRQGMGRVVDVSAGETVPRVPRRGFLSTFVGYSTDLDGIRRHEFAWTGHDGSFRIPLLCGQVFGLHQAMTLQAYRLDSQGAIVEALTTGQSLVSTRLATSFNLKSKPGEQLPRAVTFECVELNGPSFYDARFLEPLAQASLIDAVRGGAPKQHHFSIDKQGQMWGLIKPEVRWQLTVRAGASGVRMALLNAAAPGTQGQASSSQAFRRGFAVDEALPSIATHLSALDLHALNGWRLEEFLAAGIRSQTIDEIRSQTRQSLREVDRAIADDDGTGLQRSAVRAMASEIRAYRAVRDTGQDVARGAIFLMLMLVPFSVAMERLLFAYAKIGAQIVAAVGVFAVMTLVLWSFHPAFSISAQPLVIVMAFTILAMAVTVIAMVMGRFRASVREMQSSLAEGSGARMGRGGLLGSAVFLGIANMRKRKVRTALTGATVMLVTFALLCFSSASSYIDKRQFRLEGVTAAHPSVLVRRPTSGPITWAAAQGVANLLSDKDAEVGARAWLVSGLGEAAWRLTLTHPGTGQQVLVRGALGLPGNEDRMSGVDRVLPDWPRFAKEGGCYLARETAEQLGVAVGEKLVVRGHDVVLRGVFDPLALEDQVSLLDGQRLLPLDYGRLEQDWVNRDTQGAIEQETEAAGAMQPALDDEERYLPARDVIVLSTAMVTELGGTLRSLGVVSESPAQAAAVAQELTQTIVYPAYYANEQGGVNVVVATPLIAVPPRSLAVPLVIAAMIIFTTMLNSVSERKKEIYVYSSLGLAPVHIGALFVAEALTYGLMGAVFGYIAGQGTATVLTHLGWMQGVTLNYSGTAVIYTMLLVQGVVVLAAMVPAIVAGKIAAPSTEMDWRVPEPVDGEIRDTLPFTVSPAAAPGLLAFIHEYLEAHRDGVLGRFDVDRVRLMERGEGGCVGGLEACVWLAPFDMGVRQRLWLTVEPPDRGVCAIAVRIGYDTGSPKVWWRLNKPFFYELRRQMLGWRKVTPERMRQYLERMRELTGAEPEPAR